MFQGTKGIYTLRLPRLRLDKTTAKFLGFGFSHSGEVVQVPSENIHKTENEANQQAEVRSLRRVRLDSEESFAKIVTEGLPVILSELNIGSCLDKWSLDYLVDQIGEDRKVGARPQ